MADKRYDEYGVVVYMKKSNERQQSCCNQCNAGMLCLISLPNLSLP